MNSINSIFRDKKILVTGHTGFKGSWLSAWLSELGGKVIGVSNKVPTTTNNAITTTKVCIAIGATVSESAENGLLLIKKFSPININYRWL